MSKLETTHMMERRDGGAVGLSKNSPLQTGWRGIRRCTKIWSKVEYETKIDVIIPYGAEVLVPV